VEAIVSQLLFVGAGALATVGLTSGSILLGLVVGALLALMRCCGVAPVAWVVSLVRGTPVILQLSFVYFVLPGLLGFNLGLWTASVLTFGLNSAAYISEVFRAGIQAIPKGQFEAARSLRVPAFYMWRDIILPQVVRGVLPALINEFISLLKETAVVSVIGGVDIMRKSQLLAAERFDYFTPLCIAGLYYYLLVSLLEALGRFIERRTTICT
jgi:polar amino acid transport system permease protein